MIIIIRKTNWLFRRMNFRRCSNFTCAISSWHEWCTFHTNIGSCDNNFIAHTANTLSKQLQMNIKIGYIYANGAFRHMSRMKFKLLFSPDHCQLTTVSFVFGKWKRTLNDGYTKAIQKQLKNLHCLLLKWMDVMAFNFFCCWHFSFKIKDFFQSDTTNKSRHCSCSTYNVIVPNIIHCRIQYAIEKKCEMVFSPLIHIKKYESWWNRSAFSSSSGKWYGPLNE